MLLLTAEMRSTVGMEQSSVSMHECSYLLVCLITTEVRSIVKVHCAQAFKDCARASV
jgi:hypothetical protein